MVPTGVTDTLSSSTSLKVDYTSQSDQNPVMLCSLQWRQGQLRVRRSQYAQQAYTLSLQNQSRLVNCLRHSSVNLICLDSQLEASTLQFWANICREAEKQVFLRFPAKQRSPKRIILFTRINQSINSFNAIFLLIIFSPILLSIILLMNIYSTAPILRQKWRVGARGKLFQSFQFETHRQTNNAKSCPVEADAIGKWLLRSQLYQLPQLLNVLRGEIALIGRKAWTLAELDRLDPEELQHVNVQPGMLWCWQ